jgi:hypothetical protein
VDKSTRPRINAQRLTRSSEGYPESRSAGGNLLKLAFFLRKPQSIASASFASRWFMPTIKSGLARNRLRRIPNHPLAPDGSTESFLATGINLQETTLEDPSSGKRECLPNSNSFGYSGVTS